MRTPTTAGQYRYVKYQDDGVSQYQCLWCLRTMNIADDPQYGWNFCPKCGKSWFNKLECRPHDTPRWAWDRYGTDVHNHPPYHKYIRPTREWYFEERSRWPNCREEWSEWAHEFRSEYTKLGQWRWALSILRQLQLDGKPEFDGDFEFEYRVSIRNKT